LNGNGEKPTGRQLPPRRKIDKEEKISMEVILKETVEKLGEAGAQVKVADGFARNFLLPKGLALKATKSNLARLRHEKNLINQREHKELQDAQKIANKIRSLSCVMKRQAGEQEKLFGSVTSHDIADFLAASGIEIDRKKIHLEEPIKALGVHRVPIKIHPEVTAELKIKVLKDA
jgi:large subunit ribosomal protein L9